MEQQAEINKRRALEVAEAERQMIQKAQDEALKAQANQPEPQISVTTDTGNVQLSVEEVKS